MNEAEPCPPSVVPIYCNKALIINYTIMIIEPEDFRMHSINNGFIDDPQYIFSYVLCSNELTVFEMHWY
jgi:hypothetical protein